jgi:membrane protein DedA with SNARE-associated domain
VRIYLGIFLAVLSTVFVPVPEEATLLGAGYAVHVGDAVLPGAIAAAWLAVMLGDTFSYFIGRELLGRALRTRWGSRVFPADRRAWGERQVAEHGTRAIVLARFLVGLRGFIYFAVGSSRYPFGRFLLVNGAAAVADVGILVAVGFLFGDLHGRVGTWIDLMAAGILILTFGAPFLVRRWMSRAGSEASTATEAENADVAGSAKDAAEGRESV